MSFFDTLKNMGLFQGGQGAPQGQPQQPQGNPYGLDPALMRQAQLASLGSIGGQIMALSQQMTPAQRAAMMSRADWSGGLQNNIANMSQMQQAAMQQRDYQEKRQRMEEARTSIAEMIKKMPAGRTRDAAMFFFTAGDLGKAGEIAWTQTQKFNPVTAGYDTVDYFGQPVGVAAPVNSGVVAAPQSGAAPSPAPGAAAGAPVPTAIPQPDSTGIEPADQLTTNWRRLTGDPNLSPQDARYIATVAAAEGNPGAGLKAYRELQKNKTDALNKDEDQAQTLLTSKVNSAEKLTTDFETAVKPYKTVIGAAEYAANVASQPNMTPADKLAVLYNYIKTLDPLGAVRDSDVELAQSIQPVISRIEQMFASVASGGTISDEAILQIARTMASLGNDAKGRMGRKEMEIRRIAQARGVTPDMVFGAPQRGAAGPPAPIGYKIPKAAGDQSLTLPEDDEAFINSWGAM